MILHNEPVSAQVVLVVNVASKWGKTEANYKVSTESLPNAVHRVWKYPRHLMHSQDFATLEETFAGKGLKIVAFPWWASSMKHYLVHSILEHASYLLLATSSHWSPALGWLEHTMPVCAVTSFWHKSLAPMLRSRSLLARKVSKECSWTRLMWMVPRHLQCTLFSRYLMHWHLQDPIIGAGWATSRSSSSLLIDSHLFKALLLSPCYVPASCKAVWLDALQPMQRQAGTQVTCP